MFLTIYHTFIVTFQGDKSFGMSAEVIDALARQIKDVHDNGVEICVVVGGGNIFRGAKEASKGMNRTVADQVGMLATVMNALYVQSALEKIGVSARVMSGIHIPAFGTCRKDNLGIWI